MQFIELKENSVDLLTFKNNRRLVKQINGKDSKRKAIEIDSNSICYGIYNEDIFLGVITLSYLTKVSAEFHGGLFPQHQESGMQVMKEFATYISEKTDITCLIWMIPLQCKWVHRFLQSLDIPVTGAIPKSIIYNNILQDMIIYSQIIER